MRIPVLCQIEDWLRLQRDRPKVVRASELLTPYAVDGFRKCRVGAERDGGYVMLDDFGSIATAVSIGIEHEDSWDIAIAGRGIPVLQFDHTVERAPTPHPICTFARKKLVPSPSGNTGEITLAEIAGALTGDAILKLDVEGDEYGIMSAAAGDTLLKFRQVVCEFHNLHRIKQWRPRRAVFGALRALAKTHAIVHLHANNCGGVAMIGRIAVPTVLEITFVRRGDYRLRESGETFPSELDRPNYPGNPDLPLSEFLGARRRA
jgi:hypothetical protein